MSVTFDIMENDVIYNIKDTQGLEDAIQDIATLPKNLNGHTITLQFVDNIYKNTTFQLLFSGFYNGTIEMLGNPNDFQFSDSKSVFIEAKSGVNFIGGFVRIENVQAEVLIKGIEFKTNFEGQQTYEGIIRAENASYIKIHYCAFQDSGMSYSLGVVSENGSKIGIEYTHISKSHYGVSAYRLSQAGVYNLHVEDVDSGLFAGYGGRITKWGNVAVPSEATNSGGRIISENP